MDRYLGGGIVLTALGVAGYAVGTIIVYPGRAFSLTAIMVGITMLLIGRGDGGEIA